MIVEKHKLNTQDNLTDTIEKSPTALVDKDNTTLEEVENNPLEDVYMELLSV